MNKKIKCIALLLAALCLCTGCAGREEEKPVEIPEPTEKTIVLEEENLQIENLSPYDGIYIEQGDNENKDRVEGVYALSFTNTAETTIRDATLVFSDGTQELSFYMEMVPYGHTVTVVEYDKKAVKSGDLQLVRSEVNYLREGLEDLQSIAPVETDDGSLVLENTTALDIPYAEFYYRRGYGSGTLGGICYMEEIEDLGPGELIFPEPDGWSDKSVIVNIVLYPEVEEGK